jgi:UDP-N-acetyl-D-galactosamine dehydrogenase
VDNKINMAIIGLGYVGLPLAVEFGRVRNVLGFDINQTRIDELTSFYDRTLETDADEIKAAKYLTFTSNVNDLKDANFYIITVPTPIDKSKNPDLSFLVSVSETISKVLKKGDIVVYESTVYPGTTEEICVPILEKLSGLRFNVDFYAGYSPERINPGDKINRISNIKKVTSGSTPEVANIIDSVYNEIVKVGTHKAPSIRVAEASKVVENTQRDVNIALINQLAIIFDKLGIDTESVLKAAGTKWNFLPFRPGLVGGHCISVDPYYLTHKAESIGYHPDIMLACRRLNDSMPVFVVSRLIKEMSKRRIHINDSNILILGFSFKENCPDIRNSKVADIVSELLQFNANVDIYDPWVDPDELYHEYGFKLINELTSACYDAIIIAVAHSDFIAMGPSSIRDLTNSNGIIYDLKYVFDFNDSDIRF